MGDAYTVKIKNSAKLDLKRIKQSKLKEQFLDVVDVLRRDSYSATQSFEKLKPSLEGFYSRRLNRQHRVVYKVNEHEKSVEIYSAWTHYE